jgi:hypothetical protein
MQIPTLNEAYYIFIHQFWQLQASLKEKANKTKEKTHKKAKSINTKRDEALFSRL